MAFIDIIFLAIIAGVVLFRLRSLLGRNIGNPGPAATIRPLPPKPEEMVVERVRRALEDEAPLDEKNPLAKPLAELRKADPTFSLKRFLKGAESAFEMVLRALSEGDTQTLKMLLSDALYKEFEAEIVRRKQSGKREDVTLVAIDACTMERAGLSGPFARVTVRFESEQIVVERAIEGDAIIAGDPSQVERVEDIWTFERDTRSTDPNWKLIETQSVA